MTSGTQIRPVSDCPVCGADGVGLYERLTDQLSGTPGTWRMVRCVEPACGLLWLDPAPDADTLARAYAEYHTHASAPRRPRPSRVLRRWLKEGHYSGRFGYPVRGRWPKRALAQVLRLHPRLREDLDRLIMYLPPRTDGRVVDVGCGSGTTLAQLRDLGWRTEGVDSDPKAVAAASSRGLEVHLGSLPDRRYPDSSMDAVTMSHVIEHVPDPAGLLRECRRVLKPDGRLVVVTPNAASLGHSRYGAAWRGLEPPRHLQVFTGPSLRRAVETAGLRPVVLRTSAGGAAFYSAESRRNLGEERASRRDADARRFEREEQRRARTDPWAGEELVLMASPR
jgi:SAM-dependent methyltransferase